MWLNKSFFSVCINIVIMTSTATSQNLQFKLYFQLLYWHFELTPCKKIHFLLYWLDITLHFNKQLIFAMTLFCLFYCYHAFMSMYYILVEYKRGHFEDTINSANLKKQTLLFCIWYKVASTKHFIMEMRSQIFALEQDKRMPSQNAPLDG